MSPLPGRRCWVQVAIWCLLAMPFASSVAAPATSQISRDAQPVVVLVPPNPSRGFNYAYFLKLPVGGPADSRRSLLVETNNSGLSDDIALHIRAARFAIEQGIGAAVANTLQTPFLMPVFPRTKSSPLQYTHALDRDTALIKEGDLRRLDLQLLAMIDDAQERLRGDGYAVGAKVLLVGFSASGTFANRFSLLHPERIAAVAIGGVNGIAMLPQEAVNGIGLEYPIGTADYKSLFGKTFDLNAWRQIPQFLFMGAQDENDAAAPEHKDAYSDADKAVIGSVLSAKMMPDRWAAVERFYKASGATAEFKTYPNIGHGTDRAMNEAVAKFLGQYSER